MKFFFHNNFRFNVRRKSFRPIILLNLSRVNFSTLNQNQCRSLKRRQYLLERNIPQAVGQLMIAPARGYAMIIPRSVLTIHLGNEKFNKINLNFIE